MLKNAKSSVTIESFAAFFHQQYGTIRVERLYPSLFTEEEIGKLNKAEKIQRILKNYIEEPTIFKRIVKKIIDLHPKFSKQNIEELREIVTDLGFNISDDLELDFINQKETFDYDVAISYANEDLKYAQSLADALKARDVKFFFFPFEKAKLWGEDLYTYLADLYSEKARYCVMFLSRHYARKLWTNHERKAAQARAFRENSVYILPIRLDETKIPGISDTVAYVDWEKEGVSKITDYILKKLDNSNQSQRLATNSSKSKISMEEAEEIAINFVKTKNDNVSEVEVTHANNENGKWNIKGSFSTRIEGYPWASNFTVIMDEEGKVTAYNFNE